MASHLLCAGCFCVTYCCINNPALQPKQRLWRHEPKPKNTNLIRGRGKSLKNRAGVSKLKDEPWSNCLIIQQTESNISVWGRKTAPAPPQKNSDVPVKVITHIFDWHNCVIWHGGLLPANLSRLLAGFLFIHQCWIPKVTMQARIPCVCFCSRCISNDGFSSVHRKQELKLMSSRCIWKKAFLN